MQPSNEEKQAPSVEQQPVETAQNTETSQQQAKNTEPANEQPPVDNQHVAEGRRYYESRQYDKAVSEWKHAVEYGYDIQAAAYTSALAKLVPKRAGQPDVPIQFIDVPTKAAARLEGFLENLRGGQMDPIDAADYFRSEKMTQEGIDAFLKDATGKTLFQLQREAQLGMQLETPAQVSKFVNDSSKNALITPCKRIKFMIKTI